ncbi:hypothetical protein RJ641_002483 [Dillenia turbinata]|uniref:Uncharacterized protein n=1 Tax=Dillenia turbinata TaxID=194707 RepID=A0AAN8VG27_9MAGN
MADEHACMLSGGLISKAHCDFSMALKLFHLPTKCTLEGTSQLSKLFDGTATPNLIFPKIKRLRVISTQFLCYKLNYLFHCLNQEDEGATNRIGNSCSKNDIVIFQGPSTPLPNGIPTYTVQVLNKLGSSATPIWAEAGYKQHQYSQ